MLLHVFCKGYTWIIILIYILKTIHSRVLDLKLALKQPIFRWLPKHLNHIAENIVIRKRNISFLAINALFRLKDYEVSNAAMPFAGSFVISGHVPLQPNDQLRNRAEKLSVMFRIDKHNNIIPITAYSESDEK